MEQFFILYPYPVLSKKGLGNMCKAILISEVVINACVERQYPLNTSKLQKLLYFMQKEHLKKYNIPVFDEDIVAWECGPAIAEVHEYFVGGRLGFENKVEQGIVLKDSHQDVLDMVLRDYGNLSPSDVAELSRKEACWQLVWNEGKGKKKAIPLQSIYPPSERIAYVNEGKNNG